MACVRLINQLENSIKEELRVTNRDLTKRNGGSLADLLILTRKVALDHRENFVFFAQVNEFTKLTKAESALDLLLSIRLVRC